MVDEKQVTTFDATQAKPIDAPIFYADQMNMSAPGNDAIIMFARSRPAVLAGMRDDQVAILGEPVAIVQLSIQTLKDRHIAIGVQIATHEKEFGSIETTFTRKLKASQ